MLDPTSFSGLLAEYGRAIGWSVTAAIGFSFGVGLAIKVFDWLSADIDEWEEIKKDPYGFELEKMYEEDMMELDNIIDEQ